jgi:hypothetical protein
LTTMKPNEEAEYDTWFRVGRRLWIRAVKVANWSLESEVWWGDLAGSFAPAWF